MWLPAAAMRPQAHLLSVVLSAVRWVAAGWSDAIAPGRAGMSTRCADLMAPLRPAHCNAQHAVSPRWLGCDRAMADPTSPCATTARPVAAAGASLFELLVGCACRALYRPQTTSLPSKARPPRHFGADTPSRPVQPEFGVAGQGSFKQVRDHTVRIQRARRAPCRPQMKEGKLLKWNAVSSSGGHSGRRYESAKRWPARAASPLQVLCWKLADGLDSDIDHRSVP